MEQKEVSKKDVKIPDFVKWFYELDKNSGNVAGGKGANLAEIYNLKLPVPPGFVVTAQAYDYFIEKAGIKEKIKELLDNIDYENTTQLDENTKQIRKLIVDSNFPKEMQEEVLESYNDLGFGKQEIKGHAADILKAGSDPVFVAVRSSATAEDLASASFAGQQDSFVNIKGKSSLIEHIKKCFASLFTSRATYYRNKKGFKHEEVSLAVIIQKMVDSDKSGVMFTKDPSNKNNNNIIIEAVFGLGEGIVSGQISPDKYVLSQDLEIIDKKIANKKIAITRDASGEKEIVKLKEEISNSQVLKDYEIVKIAEYGTKLEKHYGKPQDVEFAIENNEIYFVQTRPITTIESQFEESKELQGEIILTGIAASPGIASGKIKIINTMQDLPKIQKGDVLVTKMTNPDMVVTMQKSAAIVTDEGGMTAHAAIVSREMGIPAVVGTQEATTKLKEGEIITIDGFHGKIYKGKVAESVQKEVLPIVETKTKIKIILDLPTYAERGAKSKVSSVGLTRMEGIIAESGKHPNYFLRKDTLEDYEEIIFKGISGIAKYFEEVWVRTSDIRSDEYANLEGAPSEKEANPMLGMHGLRASLKNPKIFKSELNALKKVTEQGKKIGLLLPQVISVEEIQEVKEILKEINFTNAKIGVMIETPASVQIIKELCEEKIEFISFGTNDLTQYTLAIDRGNESVQYIYNELHPAILHQLEYVIKICKKFNVETSICGQAGSRKEMVKELIKYGIDSISVNADAAKEISEYVAELEKEKEVEEISKKDKEEIEEPKEIYQPIVEEPPEKFSEPNELINEETEINGELEQIPEEEIESDNSQEIKQLPYETEKNITKEEELIEDDIYEPLDKTIDNDHQKIELITSHSEPTLEEIEYNKKQNEVLEKEETLDIF